MLCCAVLMPMHVRETVVYRKAYAEQLWRWSAARGRHVSPHVMYKAEGTRLGGCLSISMPFLTFILTDMTNMLLAGLAGLARLLAVALP